MYIASKRLPPALWLLNVIVWDHYLSNGETQGPALNHYTIKVMVK